VRSGRGKALHTGGRHPPLISPEQDELLDVVPAEGGLLDPASQPRAIAPTRGRREKRGQSILLRETLEDIDESERGGADAEECAQEENRRFRIPNVYSRN
jgi:hypothetical protein